MGSTLLRLAVVVGMVLLMLALAVPAFARVNCSVVTDPDTGEEFDVCRGGSGSGGNGSGGGGGVNYTLSHKTGGYTGSGGGSENYTGPGGNVLAPFENGKCAGNYVYGVYCTPGRV